MTKTYFSLDNFDPDKEITIEHHTKKLKPSSVVAELDKYVIGQEEAKRALAVSVVNHLYTSEYNGASPEFNLARSNIMLAGPSGSGKTLLVKTLARIVDKPLAIVDITEYSQTGYVGKEISEILEELVVTCDHDKNKIESSIIFIDELDKISTHGSTGEVSTSGVQRSLLKLIEGGKTNVTVGPKSAIGSNKMEIDTSDILFIFGGAFTNFVKDVKKNNDKAVVGFGDSTSKKVNTKLDHENLIKAGLLSELVGRIGTIVELNKLTEEDLLSILTDPVDSVVNQYAKLGELRDINLKLTKKELKEIVKEAVDIGTGARALRPLAEKRLMDKMFI